MLLTYPDMIRAPSLQDAWQQRMAEPEGCRREGRGNGDIHVRVIPSPVALRKERDRLLSTATDSGLLWVLSALAATVPQTQAASRTS
jgi:hypothetical protein